MADLRDIYQEVILEHAKSPRNYRALATPTLKAEGYNPLCGDGCTVYLAMHPEFGKLEAFAGVCRISRSCEVRHSGLAYV